MGKFVASHPRCYDLGEYFGFYLALEQAPAMIRRAPSPVRQAMLEHVFQGMRNFADQSRDKNGALFWCDQTPFNLLIARSLSGLLEDAVFILMLRHYRGTIQSLRRSFAGGYRWAGRQLQDSAALWATFYSHAEELPQERTLAVSYDKLCNSPLETLERVESSLSRMLGVDPGLFDRAVFADSHATQGLHHRTIAERTGTTLRFRSIGAYDTDQWSAAHEKAASLFVLETHEALLKRYPQEYDGRRLIQQT